MAARGWDIPAGGPGAVVEDFGLFVEDLDAVVNCRRTPVERFGVLTVGLGLGAGAECVGLAVDKFGRAIVDLDAVAETLGDES